MISIQQLFEPLTLTINIIQTHNVNVFHLVCSIYYISLFKTKLKNCSISNFTSWFWEKFIVDSRVQVK